MNGWSESRVCPRWPSKRRFLSKKEAKHAIAAMRGIQMRDSLQAYRCGSCSAWHVGTPAHKPRESWGHAA